MTNYELLGSELGRKATMAKVLVAMGSALDYLRPEDVVSKLAHKQLTTWATKGCKLESLLMLSSSLQAEMKRADIAFAEWSKAGAAPGEDKKEHGPIYRAALITALSCGMDFAVGQDIQALCALLDQLDEIPVDRKGEEKADAPRPASLADLIEAFGTDRASLASK